MGQTCVFAANAFTLKRKRYRKTRPARQAQHKFTAIVDAMLLSFSDDTGKAVKGFGLSHDIRPPSRAGIIFLGGSMPNHSTDRISVPRSHNNTSSDALYSESMG
jgi:hypothetical protein